MIYIKSSVFECFSSGQWRDFFCWIQSNFYYPFLCKCFGRALRARVPDVERNNTLNTIQDCCPYGVSFS